MMLYMVQKVYDHQPNEPEVFTHIEDQEACYVRFVCDLVRGTNAPQPTTYEEALEVADDYLDTDECCVIEWTAVPVKGEARRDSNG